MNDSCAFYGGRYISAYYGPVLFQSRGFFKCPVPYLYLATFFYHGPDKVCPKKTHPQKCYHRYFFIKIANRRNLSLKPPTYSFVYPSQVTRAEAFTGCPDDPIYPYDLAVERIKAAVKATRTLPFSFMLTARAENLIHGRPDLKDTIRRLEAYADAGADVLYAPGLKTREEIEAVVRAVAPRPVNVLMGLAQGNFSVDELAGLGVKRISLGSTLARVAYGSFLRAAEEIHQKGTFTFAADTVSYATINRLFS